MQCHIDTENSILCKLLVAGGNHWVFYLIVIIVRLSKLINTGSFLQTFQINYQFSSAL